ncbi:MAG: HAD hydrolase-like protein [Clostridia bacterium]|nr:HAD hydrolase-like protein [Clostridia bacterium]
MKTLVEYTKQKEWLVCVDSDGCAMDTMDIKHIRCFGPCMVREWGLDAWKKEILVRWNEINLYTLTRGINRFKGLAIALSEINEKYMPIEGIESLCKWAEESPELSNGALKAQIEDCSENAIFKKALSWSIAVNKAITELPEAEKVPFAKAKEALAFAHESADVAIVSSANLDAVLEEWAKHGLLEHTDIVLSQNAGSKAFCIGELLKKGYDKEKVVMCGDAPGDMSAAEKNGVYYYPILVKREKESWEEFMATALEKLKNGTYGGKYAEAKKAEFLINLGEKNI